MSKTTPERMADVLIQSFSNAFKTHNINTKENLGTITVTINDSCKHDKTRVGRSLQIEVGGLTFSLAVDVLKEYYRPYRDSELEACILHNVNLLLVDKKVTFITNEEIQDFITEMNEALAE